MDLEIKNKKALITGGGHGIGKSIALGLAREGCSIAICDIEKERINQISKEIEDLNVDFIGIPSDLTNPGAVGEVLDVLDKKWRGVDILVNNVGGGGRWGKEKPEETSRTIWTEVYNKNAMISVDFTMGLIPFMKEKKWGRVITIASIFGKEGGGRPWFNMAKSAQISLMKNLAMNKDLVRRGITFNSVAPGAIMIPNTGWEKLEKENRKEFNRLTKEFPLGRLGDPEEVANLVVFLCSRKASLINGSCIAIDGGSSFSF
jgi:3-oxoacyl-[acyl-carrier protein] reductase